MAPENEDQEKIGAEDEKGTTEVAAPSLTVTARTIFRHPDAHPLVLDILLLRKYGPEWLSWETESLQLTVPQDFGQPLSDNNLAKVQACKTMHLVDTYWQQWEVFLWCTVALNGGIPDFEVLQVPTVAECLVSIDIANRIREDVNFGEDIDGFLEAVYRHDGMCLSVPPTPDFHIELFDGMPEPAELEKILQSGKRPTGNPVLDEQLERRAVVEGFLEESRARLHAQIRLVEHA